MYIIAGLGNPGKEYENTRHNIGFDVIDRLAEEENIAVMESKHKALIGKGYVAGNLLRSLNIHLYLIVMK